VSVICCTQIVTWTIPLTVRSKAWVLRAMSCWVCGFESHGGFDICLLGMLCVVTYRYVSALFLSKCAIVYGIREVPQNENNLQLNGTLEILLYGNDDNLLT